MANTRYFDCPKCGRVNVIGYEKESEGDKIFKLGAGAGLAGIGAALGGPVGALAGLAVGKFFGDKVCDSENAEFIFRCPSCDHSFTKIMRK